jgi:transmembrane sensor
VGIDNTKNLYRQRTRMPAKDDNELTTEISRQAAEWWLLLKVDRRLTLEECGQFFHWLLRSRRHVSEFFLICIIDNRLTRAMRPRRAAEHVRSSVAIMSPRPRSSPGSVETGRRSYAGGWRVAAMAAVILPLGILVVSEMRVQTPESTFETAVNETKTEQLEDGSLVSLGARSKLRTEFTEKRRVVHMLEGEAMFQVEKDKARPFVVSTFLVDATAVGTKFSVAVGTTVEVEVLEGIVEISDSGAKPGSPVITLKSGQRYRVPVDSRVVVADGSGGPSAEPFEG